MSVNVSKANLIDALKQLRMRWERARYLWNDDARRQFEKDFLDPLEPALNSAIKGLDHVAELMAQVRRDCGDDTEFL